MADMGNITVADAADLDAAARRYCADRGWAMPDGSYPIRPMDMHGRSDLQKATRAVGRGGGSHDAIRRHIIKRARALGLTDMLPDNWTAEGNSRSAEETAMSTEQHYRSFHPDLQVRSSGDGRTICGIVVPWEAPTRIDDHLVEQFARGAFNHQIDTPMRVRLEREHVELGGTLIGAGTLMRNDPAGCYMELRASKTPVGDETLELVKDGALDQLSVAFRARQSRRLAGGITERVRADLLKVAVVMQGAYGELAGVTGVRSTNVAGSRIAVEEVELRMQAEEFLLGLPDIPDNDLKIRQLRLGVSI